MNIAEAAEEFRRVCKARLGGDLGDGHIRAPQQLRAHIRADAREIGVRRDAVFRREARAEAALGEVRHRSKRGNAQRLGIVELHIGGSVGDGGIAGNERYRS